MRNLEHVEGMPLEALRAGVDGGFETSPQYVDLLERKGFGDECRLVLLTLFVAREPDGAGMP